MKSRNFWENLIITAVVLVIVQTFLDDFSRYMHWSIFARNILLLTGLFFDILFSVEFTVRSVFAGRNKNLKIYWLYERGWVDFLSSFPLLILNSGPSAYLLLFGHMHEGASAIGILNVLKVVKAIRVTRILRLIRIIKIFGKIQNAESPMAQHHTSTISTTAVFTIICTLVVFSLLGPSLDSKIAERADQYSASVDTITYIEKRSKLSYKAIAEKIYLNDRNLLKVTHKDKVILSNITNEIFDKYYDNEDFRTVRQGDFRIYFSLVDLNKQVAFEHLLNIAIIIFLVLAFMLVYTRHFAQTISDLLHVMNKGFRKRDYNLQVKMREEYKDEEIYKLARFYNDAYLPAKMKKIAEREEKKESNLSIDFLEGFKSKP